MKIFSLHLPIIFCLVLCYNGVTEISMSCSCDPGFTGEFCDASIIDYSGTGSGYQDVTRKATGKEKKCVNGVPLYMNTCICHFGYTGVSCEESIAAPETSAWGSGFERTDDGDDEIVIEDPETSASGSGYKTSNDDIEWMKTPMDDLPWQPVLNLPKPLKEPVLDHQIMEDQFVGIKMGVVDTKSLIHLTRDRKAKSNGNIYRFTFVPSPLKPRSRLELTTCYSSEKDIIAQYNRIPKEIEIIVKSCKATRLPRHLLHTYKYELYLPRDFNIGGKYILTQYHGTTDQTILRDDSGCIAQVRVQDMHKMCSKGNCSQGEIFNSDGEYIGLRYLQGGYPPLNFELKEGYFFITARSDERIFIEKGGCSDRSLSGTKCMNHPRQTYNIIWKMPAKDFKFDRWVKFRWDIKWSEYSRNPGKFQNGGVITSNAWIRVWIDGDLIVDWKGPCGRNDGGTPYFKAGIYNPSGTKEPVQFFFRRFSHTYAPAWELKDEEVRRTIKNLTLCEHKVHEINQNGLRDVKRYRFAVLSSESTNKCLLHAKVNYLEHLKNAKYSRMMVDNLTKDLIMNLIYALDDQERKINELEKRVDKCEKMENNSKENDETEEETSEYDDW